MDWNAWAFPLVMLALVALAGLVFITYIWCLVNAAKNGKWAWFVLMLFFQALFIFYFLFADKSPPSPPLGGLAPRREPHLDA